MKQRRMESCEMDEPNATGVLSSELAPQKDNYDIDEIGVEAEKENNEDRFSFDTTVDELEKLMEGECLSNTVKNNEWTYRTLKHGTLLGIGDFLKQNAQKLFSV